MNVNVDLATTVQRKHSTVSYCRQWWWTIWLTPYNILP